MQTRTELSPAAKAALTVILAVYGTTIILNPGRFRLLDNVDLAIHEAGHVFASPFGEFVMFAGGTLFQLVVPITFLVHFLRRGDRYAASVLLWWVAQNLWNISTYVRDARSQALPLVGGGEHSGIGPGGRRCIGAAGQSHDDLDGAVAADHDGCHEGQSQGGEHGPSDVLARQCCGEDRGNQDRSAEDDCCTLAEGEQQQPAGGYGGEQPCDGNGSF